MEISGLGLLGYDTCTDVVR